jgi:hypothetical protein
MPKTFTVSSMWVIVDKFFYVYKKIKLAYPVDSSNSVVPLNIIYYNNRFPWTQMG